MDKLYSILVCLLLIFTFYKIWIIKFFQEYKSINKLKKNGAKANGQIISVKEVIDLDNLKTYYPEIEFKTSEGKIFTFFQLDSQMQKPELNNYVEVVYDRENPQIAIINDKMSTNYVKAKLVFVIIVTIFLLYILGAPLFKKVTLQLENGKTFVINAPANSEQSRHVQSTSINGKPFTKNWISHQDILKGGVFEATMGSKPNTARGTAEKDFPYSFSLEK